MKTLFISLCILCSCVLVSAQVKESGLFVELNVGYGHVNNYYDKCSGYVFLSPTLGYQFSSRWVAGLKTRFELAADKYKSIGLYGQYAFWQKNRVKLFGEALASVAIQSGLDGKNNNYNEAGLSLGASYSLGRRCSLLLRYFYVGYNDGQHDSDVFFFREGKFVTDDSLRRLQLGVQWIF